MLMDVYSTYNNIIAVGLFEGLLKMGYVHDNCVTLLHFIRHTLLNKKHYLYILYIEYVKEYNGG